MLGNFIRQTFFVLVAGVLLCVGTAHSQTGNIDATDKYAWSTNTGWISFRPPNGGVTVHDTHLSGHAWNENIGWITLGDDTGGPYNNTTADDWGVNRDGSGNLSGYAWNANVGWINFNPTHSQVTVDPETGSFDGYAYSENVGWIHFKNATPEYNVRYNIPPEITTQQPLSTQERTPLVITLNDLTVEDTNNTYPDDFTLTVLDGDNYTRSGNTVTPVTGFTGKLTVPVTVNDEIDDSISYNLTVTVTEKIADAPEITGQNPLPALRETTLTVTLSDLTVTPNSEKPWPDDFILKALDGENYTHSGNTLTPAPGFVGDLTVPVNVSDGVNESNVFDLTVAVEARTDSKQITGTVTYNGSGMSGLTVTAVNQDIGETRSDTTDAGGKFDIAGSGGRWQVRVTQKDDADWVSPEPATVSFANDNSSETEDLTVILETRVVRMTGRVLPPTGDTGLGEDITMNVFNSDTRFSYDFYPGADGTFSFPVPAGSYEMSIRPDPLTYPGYAGVRIPLTRISTDTDLGDIRLSARTALLSGTVTDGSGQGVPGIPVDVWQPGGEWFSTDTDAGGGYGFSLPPGTYMVRPSPAEDADFIFTGSPTGAVLTSEAVTADFVLDAISRTIVGRVRDTTGKLLTDIDAWAYARSGDSPQPLTKARVTQGGFTLDVAAGTLYVGLDLAPGSGYAFAHEIQTSRSAPSPLSSDLSPVDAAIAEMSVYEQAIRTDGHGRDSGIVTIILEPDNAYIQGAIQDENGDTSADIRGQVIATPEGNRTSVRSAEIRDGRFEIPAAEGLWDLTCQLETGRYGQADPVRVSVEEGKAATGNIPLTPLGSMVGGRVTDDTGSPASDILAWVRVPRGVGDAGGIFETQVLTDSEGEFEVFVPGGETGKRGWGSRASVGTAVQRCDAEEDEYVPPFELTNDAFDNLTGAGVPGSVITSLRDNMAYQTHQTEYAFTSALRRALNSYLSYHRYKEQILEHAASGRTDGMVVSCLREAAAQTTLPRSRPGWRRDARQDGVTLELRRADTFLAGTVLDTDENPVAGASVSAYSADGQKTDGRTDVSGDYRLYIARADESGGNTWTVTAVSESDDGKYHRGRIQCDASGTDTTVPADNLPLTSQGELPLMQTAEFRAEDGWSHTLSDGTRIQIPGGTVPTDEEFVKIIIEPRAEGVPENDGNHIVTYGYSVSLFEKESGREILGTLNRDILMTFRYSGADLLNQGIRTQNIRPAYFSEASGSWQRAETFTLDGSANKITFQTGHLSVWALVATQIGDETVPGDMNNDGTVDLADVIAVLQVCVQSSSSVPKESDVSGDGRVGLADAVHILRQIAE